MWQKFVYSSGSVVHAVIQTIKLIKIAEKYHL